MSISKSRSMTITTKLFKRFYSINVGQITEGMLVVDTVDCWHNNEKWFFIQFDTDHKLRVMETLI